MRIITIDDKKYGIRLPYGGRSETDRNNEWDRAIDAGCQLDWESRHSWCLERVGVPYRVIRGGNTDRHWGSIVSSYCGPSIGFRPILIPLDSVTLEPDFHVFFGRNGETIELGSVSDTKKGIHIGDTKNGPTIKWGVFDGKLIALSNLATRVSWDALDEMCFTAPSPKDPLFTLESKLHDRLYLTKQSGVTVNIEFSVSDIITLIQECEDPEVLKYIARYANRQAEAIEHPDDDDFRSRA